MSDLAYTGAPDECNKHWPTKWYDCLECMFIGACVSTRAIDTDDGTYMVVCEVRPYYDGPTIFTSEPFITSPDRDGHDVAWASALESFERVGRLFRDFMRPAPELRL